MDHVCIVTNLNTANMDVWHAFVSTIPVTWYWMRWATWTRDWLRRGAPYWWWSSSIFIKWTLWKVYFDLPIVYRNKSLDTLPLLALGYDVHGLEPYRKHHCVVYHAGHAQTDSCFLNRFFLRPFARCVVYCHTPCSTLGVTLHAKIVSRTPLGVGGTTSLSINGCEYLYQIVFLLCTKHHATTHAYTKSDRQ
jgi:hypothetical protein